MSIIFNSKPSDTVNWLREHPIAHRGLHDTAYGIYENTLSACAAAVEQGYSIEVDLQPSSDKVPMVFHDYDLERMTKEKGEIRDRTSSDLSGVRIMGTDDHIPRLTELLKLVDCKVGLMLELKGRAGADDGFVNAVANALYGYEGNVVIMSFDHHILEDARAIAPHLPLGLTAYGANDTYEKHKGVSEKTQIDFLSYELENLDTKFVNDFRETGRPVVSWTVKSHTDKEFSDKYADQPTFEGFTP